MKRNSLEKDLVRYSFLMALISMASSFLFLSIFSIGTAPAPLYSIFVGSRTFTQGLANVLLIALTHQLAPAATKSRKKTIYVTIGYLFAFLFFFCTAPLELYLSRQNNGLHPLAERLPPVLLQGALTNTLVILIHNLVILRHERTNAEIENARLREVNIESAYLLLKQQVHPHFLFNALSILKSLYKENIDAGEQYLSHLVSFLRTSQTGSPSGISSLSDEIDLCNNYMEMQKIRFENALTCTINIPDHILLQGSVPPFSIQSLIENAIKHNEVTEFSPLAIQVFYKDGRIITENNLQPKMHTDAPGGKGLINLMERYKILSKEEVLIQQQHHTFSVSIKVLYNEDSDYRR